MLPQPLRQLLAREHRASLKLSATVRDPSGGKRTVKKTVTPKQ
jgi:hypothetical protein